MFSIKDDKSIHLTRGDVAVIEIGATENNGDKLCIRGEYTFRLPF